DEAALITALQQKVIGGAGLDVFEREPQVPTEWRELDNVVLLPHVGSGSVETRQQMADLVLDNLRAFSATGQLLTPLWSVSPQNTPGGVCRQAYRYIATSAVIVFYLTCSIPGAPQVRRFFTRAMMEPVEACRLWRFPQARGHPPCSRSSPFRN